MCMVQFKLIFVVCLNHSVVFVAAAVAEVALVADPPAMVLYLIQWFYFSHSLVYLPIHQMLHVHCIHLLGCNGPDSSLQMGTHNRIRFGIQLVLMAHDSNCSQECLHMFVRSIHGSTDSRIEMVSNNRWIDHQTPDSMELLLWFIEKILNEFLILIRN